VMLAIDTSRSMGASDISPSRLAAARTQPTGWSTSFEEIPRRDRLVLDGRMPSPDDHRALVREALGLCTRPGHASATPSPVGAPRSQAARATGHAPDHGAPDLGRRPRRRPDGRGRRPTRLTDACPRLHRARRHA
jgi:hypothetical protein